MNSHRPRRSLFLAIALALLAPLSAQEDEGIYGAIDEYNQYISPGGFFTMPIPVLPELGGVVHDTPSVVTFRDMYGTHVFVGRVAIEEPLRTEFVSRPRKEFLAGAFATHILPQYSRLYEGTTTSVAKYLSTVHDGAVFVSALIPNGTSFADRVVLLEGEAMPAAKRGFLVFIKNDELVIISTELYERVLLRDTFKKTPEEEDAILQRRLLALANSITFAARPKPAPAPTAP